MIVCQSMNSEIDFLVLTPPVLVPTQIPVGGLLLASSLQELGLKTLLYDAALDFFHFRLQTPPAITSHLSQRQQSLWRRGQHAVSYFQHTPVFQAQLHRTHINNLHQFINTQSWPGWQMGLTNVNFNALPPHNPAGFKDYLKQGHTTPFTSYLEQQLLPALQQLKPKMIGLSLTYLSQLYFAMEIGLALQRLNQRALIGGALVNVLEAKTGQPFTLEGLYERNHPLIRKLKEFRGNWPLRWPALVRPLVDYLTPQPVIPFPLANGCYWNRCLFCPDKQTPYFEYELPCLFPFLQAALAQTPDQRAIFNISDAAISPLQLQQILPFFQQTQAEFYGFLRFEPAWLQPGYFEMIKNSGGRLLQFGLESGSQRLLNRFHKGIRLDLAAEILTRAHQVGIKNYVYLLFGLPTETEADREQTLKFIQTHHAVIDFLNIALFNLPTECEIAKSPAAFKIQLIQEAKYQQPLQLYLPFTGSEGPIRPAARDFVQNRFTTDPRVRPIYLNTPDRIRIDHAIFMR